MAGNQGEIEKGLAHLKGVDILRIWEVFGSVITVGSKQTATISSLPNFPQKFRLAGWSA
jgi:hypothetical protein